MPGLVMAQEAVTVRLDPMDESGVSGTATLTAAGNGIDVALDIEGLAPGAEAAARIYSNACAQPSASFVLLPDLKVDESGRATATGPVLSRGTERALQKPGFFATTWIVTSVERRHFALQLEILAQFSAVRDQSGQIG